MIVTECFIDHLLLITYLYLISGGPPKFPSELTEQCGLCQDTLLSIVTKLQTGYSDHRSSWKLRNTPTIGFYTLLHHYLKRHPNLPKLVQLQMLLKFYSLLMLLLYS